ncbi:MAG: DNA polymerase III subunit gamma/tau C-terminal domain-containing protein, partial [Porticoccaceae bacterium]
SSGQATPANPAAETNMATPVPPEVEPSVKKPETQVEEDSPPWEPQVAAQDSSALTPEPRAQKAEPSASLNKEEPSAPPNEEHCQPISLQDFNPDNWIELRKQLTIVASLGEIASHCLYLGRSGTDLRFLIDSNHNSLYDDAHQAQFSEALSDYFKTPVSVEISLGVAEQETPRAANLREKSERLAEAVETLNTDPAVVKFKQLFDGAVDERSVRPID